MLQLGHTPVAPSAVPLGLPGATTPREPGSEEIDEIIERFATAAAVCETAGFDGVQVQAAHGYLVTQFLSWRTNLRTDAWGGDPERRMRFLLKVVRRTRARVSPGFAVSVKLNSADFQRGGFTEEESRGVVAALAQEGLDLIEISGGSYESPAMMGSTAASTRAREAYILDYARSARHVTGDVPPAVTGGFRSHPARTPPSGPASATWPGIARPAATTTDAAHVILKGHASTLPSHELRSGHAGCARAGRRPQGARRPDPELAHRPAAPPRRRSPARPEPGPARRRSGAAAAQRPLVHETHAWHRVTTPGAEA